MVIDRVWTKRILEAYLVSDGVAGGTTPLGPVAALRRIAFLLERAREDTYKIKAFRAAAAAILPLPSDEVADRAAAGTLAELPGVGASSAAVIAAAARGEVPE